MLKRYQNLVGGVLGLADASIIVLAWLLAYWLRFSWPIIPVTKGFPAFAAYAALTPFVALLWLTVFASMRVYQFSRAFGRRDEVLALMKAHALALLLFVTLTYLFEAYKYSRLVTLYFGVLAGFALIAMRLLVRSVFKALRLRGYNLRYVLIAGEGPAVERLVERIDGFPELGLRVRGIVTQEDSPTVGVSGKPVLGHFGQIASVIQRFNVGEVMIALPWSQQDEVSRLLDLLKDETTDVRLVPDVHAYVTLGCEVEDFDGVPVVRINDSPLIGWYAALKRVTDIVVASVALIVLSPLLLLVALLVKLTSPGPVLYAQERMGLDGRTFQMLKFRSMKLDAEAATGAVWAREVDDRRTLFGTILRRTSLDELPQLWNVLCGEMSLVGPRPERPVFVRKFREEIPHYMLRHKVKSGITGWAQINGWRGNTSLRRRIECDLYYIQNWSYALDLKILTLTLWKGFVNKNAY
ncbi:MAG TPA: undecaprenyl-phosphate glucose phosphotransferase [Polyangiaceae bacterium]|nr:undecaprenyl-phosphate glucose phosphotransferase [Polyangiaceae bacterium]